jgi:peptidoglycan hydrolase CwlO-like protein
MEAITRSVRDREASIDTLIGRLAYQRLQLQKQIEDLDLAIANAEGRAEENLNAKKDLETEAAIAQAKEEAAAKKK